MRIQRKKYAPKDACKELLLKPKFLSARSNLCTRKIKMQAMEDVIDAIKNNDMFYQMIETCVNNYKKIEIKYIKLNSSLITSQTLAATEFPYSLDKEIEVQSNS